MKTMILLVSSMLALAGAAVAATATTAPHATAASDGPVDFAKCMVNGVILALKGQPSGFCYLPAEASAAAGPKESVQCVYTQVRGILDGTTPMPCVVEPSATETVGPDPKAVVECAKYAARGIIGGHPQPCPIN